MSDPLEVRPLLPEPPPRPYRSHLVLPRALTARQCEQVLALAAHRPTDEGALVEGATDDDVRRSAITWLPHDDDTAWIFERLGALARRANEGWRFELTGFTEDLQVTRYDQPGAFYTWHQDGLDGEVAGRKLSIVVQLSDPSDYDGGDLELLDVVEDLDDARRAAWRTRVRRRGTAVAFPAFEHHRVTPIERGVRTSLVCWVGGPPFR